MRNCLLVAFICFIAVTAQAQWVSLNSGTSNDLNSVDFVSPNLGWAAGGSRYIMKTIDGGLNWEQVYDLVGGSNRWNDLQFLDSQNGYACGTTKILDNWRLVWAYTNNGGNSWTSKQSFSISYKNSGYSDVFFLNNELGWRVGYYSESGTVDKTTSGIGNDWQSLGYLEESSSLYSVFFIDEHKGWVVGSPGIIAKTNDGGENWQLVQSNTDKYLRCIFFIDEKKGWITGYKDGASVIMNTDDGGLSWTSFFPSSITFLNEIKFIDEKHGWACGSIDDQGSNKGVILYTEDGGNNWIIQHIDSHCSSLKDLDFEGGIGYAVGSDGVILKTFYGDQILYFDNKQDMVRKKCSFGYTGDGTYIYAIGGENPSIFTDYLISTTIQRYNPETDTWKDLYDKLIPRNFGNAEYISGNNQICILNGETYSPGNYTDTIELFDLSSNQVSIKTKHPWPVKKGGSAMWEDKVYIFGGSNGNGFSNKVFCYDPGNDTWEVLPNMQEPKETNGAIVNGVLYVFGGHNFFPSKKIHAYDIEKKSWDHIGNLPIAISGYAISKMGKYICLIGSEQDLSFIGIFNTETNEFKRYYSNMEGRYFAGASQVRDNLYVFGGTETDSFQSILNSTQTTDVSQMLVDVDKLENIENKKVKVYPNPFNSSVNFRLNKSLTEKVTIRITNLDGKLIEIIEENQEQDVKDLIWVSTGIPKGIYIYSVLNGNKLIESGKLLKL